MCSQQAHAEMIFPETATSDIHYFMDDMAAAKVWTFLIRFLTIISQNDITFVNDSCMNFFFNYVVNLVAKTRNHK